MQITYSKNFGLWFIMVRKNLTFHSAKSFEAVYQKALSSLTK